ncbi:tape measure protein [Hymenobacter sublimis]|uniref:Tape measure protein n=1 Tax=Hymenobacter sublimis TaxID=2933777 RepID=A0ABY4JFJ6_9BACT|nr:tape measure protein [Hymenobacter sublimis]UPL50531.1 tape measure protein [Hymenobacter sublimis]
MDLEQLAIVINARIDGFEAGIKQAEKGLGRLAEGAKNTGASLTTYVTAPLGLLSYAAIKTTADIQGLEQGFKAVYKGAGDVGTEIKKTLEIAKLPGLGLKEALQGATNLQAAGFSAKEARTMLLAFGGALATVGKGKAELDRVNTALVQISNSSTVMQQDLNQLKDALPQIGTVMKQAFGASNAEGLRKAGITSKEFVERITEEFGKLPKVTGGLKNALENLSDAGTLALSKLGDSANNALGLEELANNVSASVTNLAETFASLDPATQKLILGFAGVAAGAGPVLFAVGSLGKAIPVAVEGFKALQGAGTLLYTSLGPVGIALAAVSAALVYYVATSKSATDEFKESAKSADELGNQLNPLLKRYDELSKKAKLTADEQVNLKETIQRIGEVTPGAITATDEYGNTMQISTGKAKQYLKVLQDIAKEKAATALPDLKVNYDDLVKRSKQAKAELDKLDKQRVITTPRFNSQGIQLPDQKITAESPDGIAYRKQLTNRVNLTKKAELEALNEVNKARKTIGLAPIVDAEDKREQAIIEAAKKKDKAILDSRAALEADIKKLEEETDKLSKERDAEQIASNNKLVAAKKAQIKEIDELGVGSKSDAKKAAKEISDLAKAHDDFRDGLRKVNNEFKLQGDAYDVAGEKAKVYKTYMDRLIELDKTGRVEKSPEFTAASTEYKNLIQLSQEYNDNVKFREIFLDAERSIALTAEQMQALGKTADDAQEKVKILESQLAQSLQAAERLKKEGAEENDRYLQAEIEQAKELQAELEKARVAAAQAKRDASADQLLEGLNGDTQPKTKPSGFFGKVAQTATGGGNSFEDLATGKAQSELEERIRKSQDAIRDMQSNGTSDAQIKQAKDALAGLKGELDLTDVYAGAAQQASDSLGQIGFVIVEGIGNIVSGQMSVADGLKSIFGKTLTIIGNFMKDFGKQLLLLGAGHVALGIASGNPAMVAAGGYELVAGGALALAGTLVSIGGSAITPSSGGMSAPTTSAYKAPDSVTSTKENQNVKIIVEFKEAQVDIEPNKLRVVMGVDEYRLTNYR